MEVMLLLAFKLHANCFLHLSLQQLTYHIHATVCLTYPNNYFLNSIIQIVCITFPIVTLAEDVTQTDSTHVRCILPTTNTFASVCKQKVYNASFIIKLVPVYRALITAINFKEKIIFKFHYIQFTLRQRT